MTKNMPVGKWFRTMVHSIRPEKADELCRALLSQTVQLTKKIDNLDSKRIYVAIDKHLIPRHDLDNMKSLIHSKRKNGTSKFEVYATIHAVGRKINAALDCYHILSDSTNVEFIREFVHMLTQNAIKTHLLLLDREFYAVDVMNMLQELGREFLMPAKKNATIKKAIREYHEKKRKAVSRITMKNKLGISFTYTLIIRKARKPTRVDKHPTYKTKKSKQKKEKSIESQYVAFATNIPLNRALHDLSKIPRLYRMRWGIETAYRQIEEIRPWTTSRKSQYRAILFYTSLFAYNVWAIARIQKGIRQKEMTLRYVADLVFMILFANLHKDMTFPIDPGGPG